MIQCLRLIGRPSHQARKAVLDQRTTLIELRKADRNAAANRSLAIVGGQRAEDQALLILADPGQHLCTLQTDKTAIALIQSQSDSRQPLPLNGLGLKSHLTHP